MSSLQGSPQPLAFQYSGLGPAALPPLEVAVLGHHPFTGICLLSVGWVEVCVSLNRLHYLTEHEIDERTFMCVNKKEKRLAGAWWLQLKPCNQLLPHHDGTLMGWSMGVFWHHTFWSAWAGSGSGRPSFMAILSKTQHAFYRAVHSTTPPEHRIMSA